MEGDRGIGRNGTRDSARGQVVAFLLDPVAGPPLAKGSGDVEALQVGVGYCNVKVSQGNVRLDSGEIIGKQYNLEVEIVRGSCEGSLFLTVEGRGFRRVVLIPSE